MKKVRLEMSFSFSEGYPVSNDSNRVNGDGSNWLAVNNDKGLISVTNWVEFI